MEDLALPVTLESCRKHLRLGDFTDDDDLIMEKLEMAIAIAEDQTNRPIRRRVVTDSDGVQSEEGYTADTLPRAIKSAILLILGTLYENETDVVVGRSVSELPLTAKSLLAPWRVYPY